MCKTAGWLVSRSQNKWNYNQFYWRLLNHDDTKQINIYKQKSHPSGDFRFWILRLNTSDEYGATSFTSFLSRCLQHSMLSFSPFHTCLFYCHFVFPFCVSCQWPKLMGFSKPLDCTIEINKFAVHFYRSDRSCLWWYKLINKVFPT